MHATVASGHIRVTETACEILKAGGNAFDAAVAAGFASVIAEPTLTSLGGGGFLLAKPAEAPTTLYDFFVDTPGRGLQQEDLQPHFLPVTVHFPGSDQFFNVGHGSIAVPGTLRGLLHVHRTLGRLPLHEILELPKQMAREGLVLNRSQSYVLELLKPIMTLTPAGRNLFAPNDSFLQEGDTYSNPELALFLDHLSKDGDRAFYAGEIARTIANEMRQHQGLLTAEDLAAYRVVERMPLAAKYRGYKLLTNPPPSFGGWVLLRALRLLAQGMESTPGFGSLTHLTGLITLMQAVHRGREEKGVLYEETPTEASQITEGIRRAFGGTTHVSVLDSEGNAASLSCSNGEGSGYVVPGTGIMLNNMMGEDDLHPEGFHASPPGLRVASMMSPTVLLQGDQVRLVIGSGGSKRIWSALLQVISNIVDFEMKVDEAVAAPRLHWDGDLVQMKPGFDQRILTELAKTLPLNDWPVKDLYFGGVHAVSAEGEGAGDSRRDGAATSATIGRE